MRSIRLICVSLLLIVAACTDSVSEVGLDLLEDETSAKITTTPVVSFTSSSQADITGSSPRVLVGAVDDLLTGQISANGFLDLESTFDGAPSEKITGARLIFTTNYRFGDTLSSVQLGLHEVLKQWNDAGLESDTQLNTGPEILTAIITGSRVAIDLPESWIQGNEELLKSDEFDSEFHGFALIHHEGGQVIGLNSMASSLEVVAASDTYSYPISSTLTQIKRISPAQVPSGYVLFQDGAGPRIDLTFDLKAFENQPINGAIVHVHALPSQSIPEHFVRPAPDSLYLFAVPINDTISPFRVGVAQLDEGEYRFAGAVVSVFIQSIVFGTQEVKRLELRAPREVNSLNAVLLYGTTSGKLAPSLTMILPP